MSENTMEKMKNHLTDEQTIAWIEAGKPENEIHLHVSSCEACQKTVREYSELMLAISSTPERTPPEQIRWNVNAAISEEKATLNNTPFGYWQIAAAVALLIVGFFIGKMATPDRSDEIVALQSQVDLLRELTTVNTLQTHTASERIQAVHMIEEKQTRASEKLIATLMNTLNTDESPNVRYAAAQALNRFINQQEVRLALAKSLEIQTDALIQLALISMLVEAQEKNAIKPIKKIINEETISPEVKKQARVALDILS